MTNQDELLIINNVLAGDHNAFGILVDRYQHMAYTIAVRVLEDKEEAADVVQEAFVKSYEVLDTFKGDAKFSSWLYRIVYHRALDKLKSVKRKRTQHYDDVSAGLETLSEDTNAYDRLLDGERKEMVRKAISLLKPQDQALITLYYFEEASVKEISEILDLSMDNVKIRLFRTRKRLYELLKEHMNYITD